MNTRALEHDGTMVEVYSKMKPDAFTSQLQIVLTAYYEDIKGVAGASGCTKSKVVKRKFEDQEDTERARRRRRSVRGASGALNAAQTLCLNSTSFRRGVWRLMRLLLMLLPLRRLRGGLALRRLWMPLRLRLRLRMTIESRARCRRIKKTLIGRYRHIQTNIQAKTGKYELREKCICACMWQYKS